MGLRYVSEQKKSHVTGGIKFRARFSGRPQSRQQRFYLRGGADTFAVIQVIKRLDAKAVSGQQHSTAIFIPKRKGEHAAQAPDHIPAVTLIKVQQNFRV